MRSSSMACCSRLTFIGGAEHLSYEEFGVYRNVLRTKEFCGPDGMAAMQRLMDRLRSEPPQTMEASR